MSDRPVDIDQKFPNMKPIKGPPTLFTLNGFGLMIYGKRDRDKETQTYVTSHCITLLFIPIYWVNAYRVAPASGNSYYFLGSEPLSGLCKLWNLFVISSTLVLSGYAFWEAHSTSPDYISNKRIEEARALKSEGKFAQSLRKYSEAMSIGSKHNASARSEFDALLAERFDKVPGEESAGMLQMVLTQLNPNKSTPLGIAWYQRATNRAKDLAGNDAAGGLKLLKAAQPLVTEKEKAAFKTLREDVTEKAVAQNPSDLSLVSEWALVLEQRDDSAGLKKILEPHKAKLGNTEAARILGQIYAREGDLEKSYELLEPYTTQRLKGLHSALAAYEGAQKRASDNAITQLRNGAMGESWYRSYQASDEARKQEMVDTYVLATVKNDGSIKAAENKLIEESKIVPVAMDFGIVRLQRAQGMADAAAKKKELESAEKVFLAIQGAAGGSDQYLLYYGQVLFWLNRNDEGQKQFDQLLAKNKRAPQLLLMLANIFRELGDQNAAIKLTDESYSTATKEEERHAAAGLRSIISVNLDDKILWLGRANQKELHVQAELAQTQAYQLLQASERTKAAAKFREALKIYDSVPRNATSLNNRALLWQALFFATGNRSDFKQSVDLQTEALNLDPKDTILMLNTAAALSRNAALEMLGPDVNFTHATINPELKMAGHLYKDEATRAEIIRKILANKDIQQATLLLQRLLLLSPRSEQGYEALMRIYRVTDNFDGLRELRERLKSVKLDMENTREEMMDFLKNGMSPERLKDMQKRLAQLELDFKKVKKESDKLTWVLLAEELHEQLWNLHAIGQPVDVDRFVALAEEMHAYVPSSSSRQNLLSSYCLRAIENIAQLKPEWQASLKASRTQHSSLVLLPGFIAEAGALLPKIKENADLRRVLDLVRENHKSFPNRPGIREWKTIDKLDASLASEMERVLKSDEKILLLNEIEYQLDPFDLTSALDLYWLHQARGENAAAEAAKKALINNGIAWPVK